MERYFDKELADLKKDILIRNKFDITSFYDYDKYNFNGNRIWCLIRDDFKCKSCSSEENLTVHHIDGKGFALSPENRNNNIENLTTLCNKCHNSIEDENIKVENYISRYKIREFIKIKN